MVRGGGYKILTLEEAEQDACIIIASLLGWYDIWKRCTEKGYLHCWNYEELAFCDSRLAHWSEAFEGMPESFVMHLEEYQAVYERLEDALSKRVFQEIAAFRLTLDINHAVHAFVLSTEHGEKQYFPEDIVQPLEEEVFLDAGGYLGETVLDFLEWSKGRYKRIYFLEPDLKLLNEAKENLKEQGKGKIDFLQNGIGEKEETLHFSAVGDQSGTFSEKGETAVEVISVDNSLPEPPTFLKMDIEGMELEALRGAENTIRRYKPKLAISAYHKCDDIFRLTEYILGIRSDYKVYLRHYTKGCADTVLYFL